jgi:cytochrome c-type biogenesis protein CcmH/NrfG
MGVIYARRRQLRKALDCYRRALELDPNQEMAKSQITAFEQAIAANALEG